MWINTNRKVKSGSASASFYIHVLEKQEVDVFVNGQRDFAAQKIRLFVCKEKKRRLLGEEAAR